MPGPANDDEALQDRDRLMLTGDRRVANGPLRLADPRFRSNPSGDLDGRIAALKAAIDRGRSIAHDHDRDESGAPDRDPPPAHGARPSEMESDVGDAVARAVRDELAGPEVQEILRQIVRREVARAMTARRRG